MLTIVRKELLCMLAMAKGLIHTCIGPDVTARACAVILSGGVVRVPASITGMNRGESAIGEGGGGGGGMLGAVCGLDCLMVRVCMMQVEGAPLLPIPVTTEKRPDPRLVLTIGVAGWIAESNDFGRTQPLSLASIPPPLSLHPSSPPCPVLGRRLYICNHLLTQLPRFRHARQGQPHDGCAAPQSTAVKAGCRAPKN